jgi:methylated-DNA-[protein]-cysteine S-methyltransferase
MIYTTYFKTPYGELILGSHKSKLCLCDWRYRKSRITIDKRIKTALGSEYILLKDDDEIIKQTKTELEEYWKGNRKNFTVPLMLIGTEFQKSVWNELLLIPYGTTSTYLAQSIKLNNKEAIRAVASANGANAISIIVPCHRIIGSNNDLVGYAGGLKVKSSLIKLENPVFYFNPVQLTLDL